MKKFFLFAAAAVAALTVNAQYTLNNPIGEDGRYVVLWDCEANTFAASNNFEPGQTVTIAFDITGTNWVDELKEAPKGGTRCMAANIWTNYGAKKDDTNRLKKIKDNIYGATFNFAQCIADNDPEAGKKIKQDSIVYASCQLFMFAYGDVAGKFEPGIEWYVDAQQVQADGSDCLFATQPSTGRMDEDFYSDEVGDGMYGMEVKGYAAPCAGEATAIREVVAAPKAAKVIENGQLVLIKGDVRYNVLGATIK